MEQDLLQILCQGHNLLILGQAGTGKSKTLVDIKKFFEAKGKCVGVTASTGMAAQQLGGTTLHRFVGIMDGRHPADQTIYNILHDDDYSGTKHRIQKTDILLIDEISMVSQQILSLLDLVLKGVRKCGLPFGGLQVIASGDVFQLRPVPNPDVGDDGSYFFTHKHIDELFPHTYKMSTVHRQEESDLISAVNELACGEVSQQSASLLKRLQRKLPPEQEGVGPPIHLYHTKFQVEVWNSEQLLSLPGTPTEYRSVDQGDVQKLSKCPALKSLYLKLGVPVMLIMNLSDTLVNGLRGTVLGLQADSVTVNVPCINRVVTLQPQTFRVYSATNQSDIASRRQVPLILAFALTTHKAQGLTLERCEIDCSGMRIPGQLGVAVGRVKSKKGLRVLNFKETLVTKHPECVYLFANRISTVYSPDRSCCNTIVSEELEGTEMTDIIDERVHACDQSFEMHDDGDDDDDDYINDDEEKEKEHKKGEDCDGKHENKFPIPQREEIEHMLKGHIREDTYTEQQKETNANLAYLLSNMDRTMAFYQYMWSSIETSFFSALQKDTKIQNKDLTEFSTKLVNSLSMSDGYKKQVANMFDVKEAQSKHFRLSFLFLVSDVRKRIIKHAVSPIMAEGSSVAEEAAKAYSAAARSETGDKVKYHIAGWCIAKLKFKRQRIISRNLYKKEGLKKVRDALGELNMLKSMESDAAGDADGGVQVRENRGGLTVLNTGVGNFFVELDDKIVMLERNENLALYGKNLYNYIDKELGNDEALIDKFNALFPKEKQGDMIDDLYNEIILRYRNMSAGQLRHKYLRELKTEKVEAHRKEVKIRAKVKKYSYGTFCDDMKDSEPLKAHLGLQYQIIGNPDILSAPSFTVRQLKILCQAYGVTCKARLKAHIAETLTKTIMTSTCIPHPEEIKKAETVISSTDPTEVSANQVLAEASASTGLAEASTSTQVTCTLPNTADILMPSAPKKKKTDDTCRPTCSYPCGICMKQCDDACVACDHCDTWFHFHCLNIQGDEPELDEEKWFCHNCKHSTYM